MLESVVFYLTHESEQFPFYVKANTADYFALEVPKFMYENPNLKPPLLERLRFITKSADVSNSFIAEGCTVKGSVKNSVISTGCKIAEDAIVINSVIMPDVEVKSGAVIKYAIIGQESIIGMNAQVGEVPEDETKKEICVIGAGTAIAAGEVITQ